MLAKLDKFFILLISLPKIKNLMSQKNIKL